MANVFKYIDFRKFLKDHFQWLKKNRRGITHRFLCQKAGFTSANFLKLVMDGKRNLTEQSIPAVCKAFELDGKEAEFFKSLVLFNQAKKVEKKDRAYDELKNIRRNLSSDLLDHSQMDYLEKWYHVAIRELVETKDFREDPEWISRKLKKKVSPHQVKKSLALLEKLGLLLRNKEGKILPQQKALSTHDEVAHLAAYRFHQSMIQQALEALKSSPAEEREISSLSLSVSKELFLEIKKRIQNFRREIHALASEEKNAEAVYQLNLQFFNLTETL